MVIGLGTAAAIQDESGAGAAVAGISGLVIEIGGLIGGLSVMPSAEEELAADARRQLFIPPSASGRAARARRGARK